MKGILSSGPAPGPIRLLVGSQLLLLVQSVLIFQASQPLPTALRVMLVGSSAIGLAALIAAVLGERQHEQEPWWKRRHDR